MDDRGFESRQGLGIFYTTTPRPVLGTTQSPIQWKSGALSLGGGGIKWQGREADYSSPAGAEVVNAWSYTTNPPIRLHGVVLS
jgi:hypothetical protein